MLFAMLSSYCGKEHQLSCDYVRQPFSIELLAQRPRKAARKQIQPEIGPEKAFGQALREIRKGKEVSQEQLGLDAGFDRTYISLIERGINSPTIRTVVKLAGVLKIAPSKIVVSDGGVDGGSGGMIGAAGTLYQFETRQMTESRLGQSELLQSIPEIESHTEKVIHVVMGKILEYKISGGRLLRYASSPAGPV